MHVLIAHIFREIWNVIVGNSIFEAIILKKYKLKKDTSFGPVFFISDQTIDEQWWEGT